MNAADYSLPLLSPVTPLDVSTAAGGANSEARIKQVSRAVEGIFAGQLMAELGKGIGGASATGSDSLYQDFIQQAMTQQVTSGGGFGLAKVIESYLSQNTSHNQKPLGVHSNVSPVK